MARYLTHDCGHPVACAAREARFGGFAVVVGGGWDLCEGGTIVQAIYVQYGAQAATGFADRADVDAASAAQQVVGGAGAELVALDCGPVRGRNVNLAIAVGERARAVRAAECAGT